MVRKLATFAVALCLATVSGVTTAVAEDATPDKPADAGTASPTPSATAPAATESPTPSASPSPEATTTSSPTALPSRKLRPAARPSPTPTSNARPAAARPTTFTAHSAGIQVTNATSNTWGTVPTKKPVEVWTEAKLPNGSWSKSQTRTTNASGGFVIPLTYGSTSSGTTAWRVSARLTSGQILRSKQFDFRRVHAPTAASAGTKMVKQATNTWGKFDVSSPIRVHTQVWLGDHWSTSQVRTTTARGDYVIPLIYGSNATGTWTWRVVGTYPEGTVATREFKLQRIAGANPVIRATTTKDLAGYWNSSCPMGPSRLRTINVNYWDYNNRVQRGTIVVRADRAKDVAGAFTDMFNNHFYIAQMRLPGVWKGSDTAMMAANNTSGFNCRKVVGNPYRWSPHAYGYAVDINPAQNPYLDPKGKWWPNSTYAHKRPAGVKGMHYQRSTSVRSLTSRGWKWFSGWDWHHFERR